jgi:protein-disulfide isomerase
MAGLTVPVRPERDHIKGTVNAPLTLVEYGDYECPYCGAAYPVVKQIQQNLGDQVCFVFRNFPLTQAHPHAQHAAEAAEAAGAQGQFWEMHDMLFEHQEALDDLHLIQYATNLKLDVTLFELELATHVYAGRVREDFMSGVRSGVNGTPTFFINGRRHDGPHDLAGLTAALQQALAEARMAW